MFWDSVAGVYDLFVNVVNPRAHVALRKIVADLLQPGDDVLECACGTGLLTEVIAQRCAHLTATDFAPKKATGNSSWTRALGTCRYSWPRGASPAP